MTTESNPLSRIATLFAADLDERRAAAIDEARAVGHTWQDIATAMGHDDRRTAEGWHRRHKGATCFKTLEQALTGIEVN